MKHNELPYIDDLKAKDEEIDSIMCTLEDAMKQCSNPDHSNYAMAKLCKQTYQNLEHIREVAKELLKRRAL